MNTNAAETEQRTAIDQRIAELIQEHGTPNRSFDEQADDTLLDVVIEQGLASSEGGKRLRALLCLSAFDAAYHQPPAQERRHCALDVACAIEVFQTAALVHDDIIDESDLRRGKPAAHKALASSVAAGYPADDAAHAASIGNGLGIMLGDLLATASVSIVNEATVGLSNHRHIVDAFLSMHRDVEIGQVLDLAAEQLPLDDPDTMIRKSLSVFRWKTASYTTIAPLALGLLAADLPLQEAWQTALEVGKPLGLAFQLADDLLDVISDSAITGKPIGGDIREGKRTVLLADALKAADDVDRQYLQQAYAASHRDEQQVATIISLFESTGAIDQSRNRIAALWQQTENALHHKATALGFSDEQKAMLTSVCTCFVPDNIRRTA